MTGSDWLSVFCGDSLNGHEFGIEQSDDWTEFESDGNWSVNGFVGEYVRVFGQLGRAIGYLKDIDITDHIFFCLELNVGLN